MLVAGLANSRVVEISTQSFTEGHRATADVSIFFIRQTE
jgi:hypothetical protein